MGGTSINLLPAPRVLRRRLRIRLQWWGAGLAVYAGVILLGLGILRGRVERIAVPDDSTITQRIAQLNTDTATRTRLLAEARSRHSAALLLAGHPDWSRLLALLGDLLGDEAVLRQVKLSQHKTADARSYSLELRGLARTQTSVSAFVSRLETLGLFGEVRLLRTGREPFLSDSAVSFEVQCTLSDQPQRERRASAETAATTGGAR